MHIRQDIQDIAIQAIKWREAMHASPGIAYDEKFAGDLVKSKLAQLGYAKDAISIGWGKNPDQSSDKKGGHGVVLSIQGRLGEGKTIGFRADMDALPITEETGLSYASKNDGVMHACGHDGHTAALLSVAQYFSKAANRNFRGQLKLVFQPAEEGAKGAKAMIDEGLFQIHPMDAIFAMHNWPDLPYGKIAVHPGPVMAASDYFKVIFKGKTAHAGKPDQGISTPDMMNAFMNEMPRTKIGNNYATNQIVSIGHINAGASSALAIIPGKGEIAGTVRIFDDALSLSIQNTFEATAANIAAQFGAEITLEYRRGSPATINDPEQAKIMRMVCEKVADANNVLWDQEPGMTAEDFGFMASTIPAAYIWVGQGDAGDPQSPNNRALHNAGYDSNNKLIGACAELFVSLAEHGLG